MHQVFIKKWRLSIMKYYVYVYLNPEITGNFNYLEYSFNLEPFYIGKGTGNRCYYHLMNTNRLLNSNLPFYNKLKNLKLKNILPEIKILKYFDNEQESYNHETELIKLIGSTYISEINDGPLKNTCLIAQPPNHKGKTYKEIYGDRAEEQRKLRHEKQIKLGGFFKGHKHTEDSKKKIGIKTSQIHTGLKRSEKTKSNISKSKIGKCTGDGNPNAKTFLIVSPSNNKYIIKGEFKSFCLKNNLSESTLKNTIKRNEKVKSGRTKDWQAFILPD